MFYLSFAREHPGHYELLFGRARAQLPVLGDMQTWQEEDEGGQLFGDLVASVTAVLVDHQRHDIDPVVASVIVWTALHGLIELQKCKGDFPWPDDDTLLAAIGGLLT
jgi:hypothetical protein